MQPSQNCLKLIKHYELFMAGPYICPAGVVTIGYGTTVYATGKAVSLRDKKITEATACEYLAHDLEYFTSRVKALVKVPFTQSRFDALVSFAYNLGAEALSGSTLLKKINAGAAPAEITAEFMKWVKARQNGKLVTLRGLEARRRAEALLYTNGTLKFFTA